MVELVGVINYKNLSVICGENSHGQRISNHLVISAIIFTFTRPTLNFHHKTISMCSLTKVIKTEPISCRIREFNGLMLSNRISRIVSLFDGGDEILFGHENFFADIKKLDICSSFRFFDFDDKGIWNPFDVFLALVFSFIL